ncbi:ECF transporter S component [Anaerobacillus alkalilacustris]|uniref:ECF transporter S component n=2 Tax=Anaerobacillus alkalilacustris TaxID=393763 RepID=A0A1S2LQT6_9BACI|nr:ECF transporter S component [Anaerobacillus alkalilacustris]
MAMLCSLAVVGRLAFTFIPNVQPTTAIILLSALSLGAIPGIMIAIVSTLVTNFILGTGIWTLWQVVSWSMIALITGLFKNFHQRLPVFVLSLYAGLCGLIYGFIISIPMSRFVGNFWGYYLAGLPFDISHSIGNIVFFSIFYPIYFKIFKNQFKTF